MSDQRAGLTRPADVRPPVPAELLDDPWFPFTGDVRVKQLHEPVTEEPPRSGEGGQGCRSCEHPDTDFLWTDKNWRLRPYRPTELLGQVLLETRAHHDSFADLPDELLRELGPLVARIEGAILGLGGVGRVHVARWGDGGEHFHLWFMPRPFGALQLRGSMLPMWVDFMPRCAAEDAAAAERAIAAALAAR
ncbi:MAG TPA: hypothetical protein VEV13_03965 [Candidatus Limnocylindria bacterium]|nr:hypothetical protein [Candidatus Limnocylindria bacterium]